MTDTEVGVPTSVMERSEPQAIPSNGEVNGGGDRGVDAEGGTDGAAGANTELGNGFAPTPSGESSQGEPTDSQAETTLANRQQQQREGQQLAPDQQPSEQQQKEEILKKLVDLGQVTTENGEISPITKEALLRMGVDELNSRLVEAQDFHDRELYIQEFVDQGFLNPEDPDFEQQKQDLLALSGEDLHIALEMSQVNKDQELQEALASGDPQRVLNRMAALHLEAHQREGMTPEQAMSETLKMAQGFAETFGQMTAGVRAEWMDRMKKTWDEGFIRLIDNMIKGADASGGGGEFGSGKGENSVESQVSEQLFLKTFSTNPGKFAEGLLNAYTRDAGLKDTDWQLDPKGEQLLRDAVRSSSKESAAQAIRAVIMGKYDTQQSQPKVKGGLLEYLYDGDAQSGDVAAERWSRVSSLIAKEIFQKKTLGGERGEVGKLFKRLKDGDEKPDKVFSLQ